MLGFAQARQVSVNGGDDRALVSEVDLDLTEVLTLLQQMGRVGMARSLPILHIRRCVSGSSIAIIRATA